MRTTIKWTDAADKPAVSGLYTVRTKSGQVAMAYYSKIDLNWVTSARITHFALPEDITTEGDA